MTSPWHWKVIDFFYLRFFLEEINFQLNATNSMFVAWAFETECFNFNVLVYWQSGPFALKQREANTSLWNFSGFLDGKDKMLAWPSWDVDVFFVMLEVWRMNDRAILQRQFISWTFRSFERHSLEWNELRLFIKWMCFTFYPWHVLKIFRNVLIINFHLCYLTTQKYWFFFTQFAKRPQIFFKKSLKYFTERTQIY